MEEFSLNMWCMIHPSTCFHVFIFLLWLKMPAVKYGSQFMAFALTSKSVIVDVWVLADTDHLARLVVSLKAQTEGSRSWVRQCPSCGDELNTLFAFTVEIRSLTDWSSKAVFWVRPSVFYRLWVFSGHSSSFCWGFLAALLVLLLRYLLTTTPLLSLVFAAHLSSFYSMLPAFCR